LLFFTGKIIKLNYEVNETLKTYDEVLENVNHKKPIDQENEENLLDLSMSSISPGKIDAYYLHKVYIYIFLI